MASVYYLPVERFTSKKRQSIEYVNVLLCLVVYICLISSEIYTKTPGIQIGLDVTAFPVTVLFWASQPSFLWNLFWVLCLLHLFILAGLLSIIVEAFMTIPSPDSTPNHALEIPSFFKTILLALITNLIVVHYRTENTDPNSLPRRQDYDRCCLLFKQQRERSSLLDAEDMEQHLPHYPNYLAYWGLLVFYVVEIVTLLVRSKFLHSAIDYKNDPITKITGIIQVIVNLIFCLLAFFYWYWDWGVKYIKTVGWWISPLLCSIGYIGLIFIAIYVRLETIKEDKSWLWIPSCIDIFGYLSLFGFWFAQPPLKYTACLSFFHFTMFALVSAKCWLSLSASTPGEPAVHEIPYLFEGIILTLISGYIVEHSKAKFGFCGDGQDRRRELESVSGSASEAPPVS